MRIISLLGFFAVLCLGVACNSLPTTPPTMAELTSVSPVLPTATSTVFDSPLIQTVPLQKPTPTETLVPDTGWQLIEPGLERRLMNLKNHEGEFWEHLYLLRIDPSYFRFEVGYDPEVPKRLMDWQSITGAKITFNGGFFTETYEATGLVISNEGRFGASYQGFGGMFLVSVGGPEIRSLTVTPYDPSELILFGVQSFPMLVQPGGEVGLAEEDGKTDRRTAIAQDSEGRIILILATSGRMTLYQLGDFLINSDLDVDRALNLDGGSSSGVLLADPIEGVPPFVLLPIVVSVHNK